VYCIDASVLVSIFDENDIFHPASFQMFEFLVETNERIVLPALPELL